MDNVILEVNGGYEAFLMEVASYLYEENQISNTTLEVIFGTFDEEGNMLEEGLTKLGMEGVMEGLLKAKGYEVATKYDKDSDDMGIVYQLIQKEKEAVAWAME